MSHWVRRRAVQSGTTAVVLSGILLSSTWTSLTTVHGNPAHASLGSRFAGKTPIVLGELLPFTGPNALRGKDMQLGYNLAVNTVNAAGGVMGRPLKLRGEDTASDPADAVAAAHKVINVDGAQEIVGPATITGPAILPIAAQSKVPEILVGGSTQLDKDTNPYYFRTSPSDSQQGVAMAYYALHRGWKTGALVFTEQPAAQTLKAPIAAAFQRHGGKIVSTVDIVPGQSSYRSEIQRIFANHPQVVFTQLDEQTAGVLLPETQQMGDLKVPWLGTNLLDTSDFYKAVGQQIATSVVYATQGAASGGIGFSNYLRLYKKAYHTSVIANLSQDCYDSVILMALAMDYAHSTNGAAVDRAITKISNPPGIKVGNYGRGMRLINRHQKINWEGAATSDDFNRYHNVFGPFAVLKFQSNGVPKTIATIPAKALGKF